MEDMASGDLATSTLQRLPGGLRLPRRNLLDTDTGPQQPS